MSLTCSTGEGGDLAISVDPDCRLIGCAPGSKSGELSKIASSRWQGARLLDPLNNNRLRAAETVPFSISLAGDERFRVAPEVRTAMSRSSRKARSISFEVEAIQKRGHTRPLFFVGEKKRGLTVPYSQIFKLINDSELTISDGHGRALRSTVMAQLRARLRRLFPPHTTSVETVAVPLTLTSPVVIPRLKGHIHSDPQGGNPPATAVNCIQ